MAITASARRQVRALHHTFAAFWGSLAGRHRLPRSLHGRADTRAGSSPSRGSAAQGKPATRQRAEQHTRPAGGRLSSARMGIPAGPKCVGTPLRAGVQANQLVPGSRLPWPDRVVPPRRSTCHGRSWAPAPPRDQGGSPRKLIRPDCLTALRVHCIKHAEGVTLVRRGVCAVYRPLPRNVERRQGVDQARSGQGLAQSGWDHFPTTRSAKARLRRLSATRRPGRVAPRRGASQAGLGGRFVSRPLDSGNRPTVEPPSGSAPAMIRQ